jgi:hypothetical protein
VDEAQLPAIMRFVYSFDEHSAFAHIVPMVVGSAMIIYPSQNLRPLVFLGNLPAAASSTSQINSPSLG